MKAIKKSVAIILSITVILSAFVFSTFVTSNALSIAVSLGCYNSTEGSALATGTDTANKYVATQIFTKEDLPNGTEIRIDQGYKYRPEGWVSLDQKNESRPSQVYGQSTVIVDDEWWGDYNYRAFNISKSNEVDISSSYKDVASHFTITLPSEIEEKTIRVLAIGNSFSNDAFHYAEQIAAEFGYKTEFLSLYQSGCYISKHLDNYNNQTAAYTIYRNGVQVRGSVTMNQILKECDFDYITLQQGSARSNKWSYYYSEENPYIVDLYNAIKAEQPNAEFLIHQTWGYSPAEAQANGHTGSLDHFTAIENCYNKAAELLNLPLAKSGKAIQLVKDYGYLTDDRGGENSVYADEYCHLTDRGDFIAGCVLVETIFGVDIRTKDFTSLFADSKNLCKVAHQAVTGEVDDEDEQEEVYYEPDRTMLRYKRTSNGYFKCLYKLPTTLEANTEYTVTIATKHVTSTTNMIFALYGIDKNTSIGEPTNTAFKADGALLYSSDSSGVHQFTTGTNDSYGRFKTYKFTLTEDEVANKKFYLGYDFNRSEAVEFYISDFALYKSSDETKTSLLGVDDYSTNAEGWCTPYGEKNSAAKYVEYNPSYFKTAYHVYMDSSATEKLAIRIPANLIKADKKYTISFNYYMMNRGLDYGMFTVLYGMNTDSGKNLVSNAYSLRCYNGTAVSGSKMKAFTDISNNIRQSRQGKASYSFTVTSGVDLFNDYYVGFYLLKTSDWTSNPDFYITDFKLCEEGSDENLIPANQYTTSNSVGSYAWKESYGWVGNSGCGFANSYVAAYTGDANMDGEMDIRDLVKIDEDANDSLYNLFADTNEDKTTDKYDVKNIRHQLLGLGITIPKQIPKPVIPQEPENDTPFDVIPSGDVTATKTASKSASHTILPGEKVSYAVKLTNNEATAQDAVLFEKLPEGIELAGGDCELKNGYIAWSGNIGAGETQTVNYTLKVSKDDALCGTVLEGENTQVNKNFATGYDLYIERTASGGEDQRYISNAIRAMKDSTYRDTSLVAWIYSVAFTKSTASYFPDTPADTLTKIVNGTANETTLDMVAPSLYGGNDVKGAISGIKGAPCENVTASDLMVGDVLFANDGQSTKNYIFDKDGLVDLSAPMSAVDTNSVLSDLSTSEIFAVFRPSMVIKRDYILDEEFEELDLTEQQQAVIATAESYILRGEKLQYSDTRFGGIDNTEYRWNAGNRNPEYTNRDEWGYINCAGFTYEVYNTALGIDINYNGTSLWSTGRLQSYAYNEGIRVYSYKRNATDDVDGATMASVKQEVLDTLQPCDMLVVRRSDSSGHVVLYVGNGTFIHSTGSVYKVDDGEYYEPTIKYQRVEDYFFTKGQNGYLFKNSDDAKQITEFLIVRPLKKDKYNVELPEETVNRMNNMEGIMAQKLSSHNSTTTANRGEEITYSFELYNTNDTAKTVEVRDTVPANTTYVSGADIKDGNNLSWLVTIPANTRTTVSYTVKVNDNATYGDYIQTTTTSTVGGVRTICPKVYINRTLTKAEQDRVVEAFNTLKANGTTKTGLALVNEIYATAGLSDMGFTDTDFATVMEGAEGTFKVVTQQSGNDYYQLTDKGNKYRDMMVETLYGGRRYYGFSGDERTDRTRLAREHNIMVGDVIIRRISSGTYYAYLHIGGDHYINITSGISTETTTAKKRLELLLSSGRYYAVYRPSFGTK